MSSTIPTKLQFMKDALHALHEGHLYRELNPLPIGSESWITVNDRRLLNLSSNNYLGLATHPRLVQAACDAAERWGCGAGASRLVSGTYEIHSELESRLAYFKGLDSALLFSSGYMANLGIIQALMGPGDLVVGDEYNHASLIDGCRLSRADYKTYAHCDPDSLKTQLSQASYRRRLVVTDSIFSMDGDIAPLQEIAALCKEYDALLMVDEAHATGCYGPGGRGVIAQEKLEDAVVASIGTLSKALGGLGAFMAGPDLVRQYLINKARTFIFTTALPPMVIATALAALNMLESTPGLVESLQAKAGFLRSGLQNLGYNTLASATQIIPVMVGDPNTTLEMAEALRQEGIFAVAIRPPSVPLGKARIRLSVMACHSHADLTFAIDALQRVGQRLQII